MSKNTITKKLKKYKKSGRSLSTLLEREKQVKLDKIYLNYSKDRDGLISSMNGYIEYADFTIANLKTVLFTILMNSSNDTNNEDYKLCSSYIDKLAENKKKIIDIIDVCKRKPDKLDVIEAQQLLMELNMSVIEVINEAGDLNTEINKITAKYKDQVKEYIDSLQKKEEGIEFTADEEKDNGENKNEETGDK